MMPTAAITAFMVGLPRCDRKKAGTLKQWATEVKSAMLRQITNARRDALQERPGVAIEARRGPSHSSADAEILGPRCGPFATPGRAYKGHAGLQVKLNV
ncbi:MULTISPECIES: hypothetical protein [Pseudomonas]|uniref:hypothetical protein n=1 Tax=Pseudomonas TaxID=286 RepID=UPI001644C1FB|nr:MULTISPECIES: hypothetical protein [Pseudomonas]QXI45768.1 hypothetical protein HU763_013330 [Pseudomonas anuradhapurensis]